VGTVWAKTATVELNVNPQHPRHNTHTHTHFFQHITCIMSKTPKSILNDSSHAVEEVVQGLCWQYPPHRLTKLRYHNVLLLRTLPPNDSTINSNISQVQLLSCGGSMVTNQVMLVGLELACYVVRFVVVCLLRHPCQAITGDSVTFRQPARVGRKRKDERQRSRGRN
jgi:hypothetical protein